MKSFAFEHVFRAPSATAVVAAQFDPDHVRHQDHALAILEREVLELEDGPRELRRTCRVVPRRQLPPLVRPFVSGQLHYLETWTWRKPEDRVDVTIRPSLLGSRAEITATYRLSRIGPGLIRRTYQGVVSVDVALISARIERGIVAEFERSMPIATATTQAFLDALQPSVSART